MSRAALLESSPSGRLGLLALMSLVSLPLAAASLLTAPRAAGEGEGPFQRLVIRNATMIDGTGAPQQGPIDIVIEGDRIADVVHVAEARASEPTTQPSRNEKIIDARGAFVMPGIVDTHVHAYWTDTGEMPTQYAYKLWLAHGVTTVRAAALLPDDMESDLRERAASASNAIVAPHLVIYSHPGQGKQWRQRRLDTAQDAREWVRYAASCGIDGIKLMPNFYPEEVTRALLEEARKHRLGTLAHMSGPQGFISTTALDMARMGLDTMTHMNGLFQPLLKHSNLQPYPADFVTQGEHGVVNIPLQWEQIHEPGSQQWNALLDELLQRDLYINPTLAITSALRDQARARNEVWHGTYTLPALWQAFQPSLTQHGSVFYDWTTAHEVSYRNFYQVFMRFLREFHARGGKVTLGSDAGFIYKIYGFTSIEELELLQEAGLTPLEVVRAATKYGAMELARASGKPIDFGVIRPGLRADLLIVEENPLQNFKVLYGTGVQRLDRSSGRVESRGGVKYTIKGGVVYDAKQLLRNVADMVAAARQQQ